MSISATSLLDLPAPYQKDGAFFFAVRIYYEDTDAAGVVYYANYLKFAERARTEWLRHLGLEQQQLLSTQGVGFVVTQLSVRYKHPAKLDDILHIETRLQHRSKVRMSMRQILRTDASECAVLEVEIACVAQQNGHFVLQPLHQAFSPALLERLPTNHT